MPFFGVPIRNGLPIGLGSVAGFGVQQFDPLELFASGAEGVWYDPSDTSTLFQDSAGTTPVTAVEQAVGLMLDKSKGLVLGSELVTFSALASTAEWSFSSNTWTLTNSTTNSQTISFGGLTSGKWYQMVVTVGSINTGSLSFRHPNSSTTIAGSPSITAAGTYSFYFYSSGTTVFLRNSTTGQNATVTAFSVRELPGNHAISYNATTARPTLSARVNLLTYSEEFDNAYWSLGSLNAFGSGSVANTTATTDPLGNNTADFIQENLTLDNHGVFVTTPYSLIIGTAYTWSIYVKPAGRSWVNLRLDGTSNFVDTANGTIGTVAAGSTVTATPVGNGWYRCSVTRTATSTSANAIRMATSNGVDSYTGDGTSGIYIWGADLRPANIGSAVPAYQRIAAATDYDTNGFPKYLYFAGTDDGMSTPANLNLTSTNKVTVFAGVRKLSDAVTGVLTELSADIASNNGTFAIVARTAVVANSYNWASRGTLGVDNAVVNAFTAPVTGVITGIADIAAPVSTNRLSGAVLQTLTTSQGTGNYGSYPLYIGSRNNASAWFNGYLYGLTVVGAQLTAPQIESMENWTGGKTGISVFNQGPSISLDFTDQSYQVWEI